tara:strand:- start:231 stop:686 length:456 start_codon:yes stop_codon:yes gene_type:complete
MPQINQLPASDELQGGDLFAVYKQANGDARKVAASVLLDYVKANSGQSNYVTQSVVVASSGFNTSVASNGNNIWLILNLTASFASGTITLPPLAEVVDGQEVLVFCNRQVTSFSVDGNGAVAVNGAPTSLSADAFFTLRFSSAANSWYRIG